MVEGSAKFIIRGDRHPLALLCRRVDRRKEGRGIGGRRIDHLDLTPESRQRENGAVVPINEREMATIGHDGSNGRGTGRAEGSQDYLRRKKNSKT